VITSRGESEAQWGNTDESSPRACHREERRTTVTIVDVAVILSFIGGLAIGLIIGLKRRDRD
jgi:hypothetical protein